MLFYKFVEHKVVACCQLLLQGVEDYLTAGLEPPTGEFEYLMWRLSSDDRLDHGPGSLTMQIADYYAKTHTTSVSILCRWFFSGAN